MPDRLLDGLPDCQLQGLGKRSRRVFCYTCGESCGKVWGDVIHAYILCDRCFFENGTPPGLIEIPEAAARGLA